MENSVSARCVTTRRLIVARIKPGATGDVARLFGASDRTALPGDLGVVRRDLFHHGDRYFHLVEFAGDDGEALARARDRTDFRALSADLDAYITPVDPTTWRGPQDAMATCFYSWASTDGTARR